jgi:DNA-binding NarL/FixJ family response regulator
LIAESWDFYREGLIAGLQAQPGIRLIGSVSTTAELLHWLQQKIPDVILLDAQLSSGGKSDLLYLIRQLYPELPILLLSITEEPEHILHAVKQGANGYLPKKAGICGLMEAISAIVQGDHFTKREVTARLIGHVSQAKSVKTTNLQPRFSNRELEVVRMICQELSSKEIAAQLQINSRSVESYRERIQKKIGAKNMVGVVLFAIRTGIFFPN